MTKRIWSILIIQRTMKMIIFIEMMIVAMMIMTILLQSNGHSSSTTHWKISRVFAENDEALINRKLSSSWSSSSSLSSSIVIIINIIMKALINKKLSSYFSLSSITINWWDRNLTGNCQRSFCLELSPIWTLSPSADVHRWLHLLNIARGTTDPGYWVWNLNIPEAKLKTNSIQPKR